MKTILLILLTLGQTVIIAGHVRTPEGKGVPGIKVVVQWLGDLDHNGTVDLRDFAIYQNAFTSLGLEFWSQMSGQMMGPGAKVTR